MRSRTLLNPKLLAVLFGLLAFSSFVVLTLDTLTSQGHAAAIQAINDPSGPVVTEIGMPTRTILVGFRSRVLTVNHVSQACGSRLYLVFTEKHWSWVEVSLYKRPNEWNWIPNEVVLGWSSRFKQHCDMAN
jgi:hypothetical protein